MPFGGALTLGAIGAGTSIFGSIFGNRKKETTSTTTPTLSPELQTIMDKLLADAGGMMTDPTKGLAPVRLNAMEAINSRYAGSGDRIATSLAKRGYQSSGQAPGAFTSLERSRLQDFSGLESDFAKLGSDRQLAGANIVQNVLARMTGSKTVGVQPGNAAGAGLSAAGSSLGSLAGLLAFGDAMDKRRPVNFDDNP
jgi:hypothetical protein